MGNVYNSKKNLIQELAKYNLCRKEVITKEESNKYANEEDKYIDLAEMHYYLCELDDFTNTRILLGIFKCVNFIKNVILAGLICGGIGIGIIILNMLAGN